MAYIRAMLKYILLVGISAIGIQLNAQFNHEDVFESLNGEVLIEALQSEFKPANVLDFSDSRDTLFAVIYAGENNSLECVYSGHTVTLDPNEDPTISAFQAGAADGINTEHTYPQSMGAKAGNAKSDMHHLYPSRAAVNSARSNDPFMEITDNQTARWFYQDQVTNNVPNSNIDAYSEDINNGFEPKEAHKGNVARAMFYFITIYQNEALAANPDYFESQKETLCDWHWQDPVDEQEWDRNQMIAKYQDDKTNPFILDCSLAARAYCQDN